MDLKTVSIVIPCLNEEKTIGMVVREAMSCGPLEVIVSDNGSQDASVQIAESEGARVVHCPRKGYGSAIDYGIREAKGEIVVFADADMSYPLKDARTLVWPILQNEADMVLGNRLNSHLEKGAMPFLNKYFGTPVLSFCIRTLYEFDIHDCNSGMRALRKDRYQDMKLISSGMEYASEMIIRSQECKLRYQEVPIHFRKDQRGRAPHLSRWRDGWRHLRYILGCAPNIISITMPFIMGLICFLGAIFLSYWNDPAEAGRTHYHSAFVLLSNGALVWIFLLSSVTIKVIRDLNDIHHSKFVRKLIHFADQAYLFYLNLILWGLALLQFLALVLEWKVNDFGELAEPEAVVRITTLIIMGAFVYAVDSVISLLSMNTSMTERLKK